LASFLLAAILLGMLQLVPVLVLAAVFALPVAVLVLVPVAVMLLPVLLPSEMLAWLAFLLILQSWFLSPF
ncbi:hypothetical protein, partial [Candidatus Nitrosotenuis cloacae]|uniref:hypothetical protein n=1 Tax=Candidatus Nitrosotenuis cloacae TaxID=1603555 RepID=UPI0022802866